MESVFFCGAQDYRVLVRDLATTLLFLMVFLKAHSEELRAAGNRLAGEEGDEGGRGTAGKCVLLREDVSRDVNAVFSAVADVFHCWFSSPVSGYIHTLWGQGSN